MARPDGALGFVRGPGDSVEAIGLEHGERRWALPLAARPLVADGERLVLVATEREGPALAAVVVDGESGREVGRVGVSLPAGVPAAAPPDELELAPRLAGATLRLGWAWRPRYRGGAPPPAALDRALAGGGRAGTLIFDLAAGTAANETHEPPAEPPSSWPYRREGRWRENGWRCGAALHCLRLTEGSPEPVLELFSLDPEARVEIACAEVGSGRALEPTVTPDGRHLFVRVTAPPGGPWRIHDAADGATIAEVPWTEGAELPVVLGRRAYTLIARPNGDGLLLRALDLDTAGIAWDLPLGAPPQRRPPPLPR